MAAFLRDKQMLIVLDNCEHVIGAAATLAEAALKAAPGLHILATSREPLRAEGEWVQRLPALQTPQVSNGLVAAEALAFPAIQLFVERATASFEAFTLPDADARIVVDICRRLDGIPLAIELAAARVELLGMRGLAAQLDDRFALLTKGRRTAVPRHLKATLDWSYDLLSEPEQLILRRLAVFAGIFTLEAASAVVADGDLTALDVREGVTSLAAKSLLAVDIGGDVISYKLLELTRAYAAEKLGESDDLARTARRHAGYYRALLEQAEAEWQTRTTVDWLATYGPQIDNVRAALDWTFSVAGDVEIGVPLTAAGVPLWMHLSLVSECRTSVARALAQVSSQDASGQECADAGLEMRLLAALGLSLIYTQGRGPEIHAALAKALEIAERRADTEYQLRALWGLFVGRFNEGDFLAAETLARRFRGVAEQSSDPYDKRVGDRLLGFALHFLGEQSEARQHIERMLSGYIVPDRRSHLVRYQYDQRVAARVPLSAILWLQGYPDQAIATAIAAVEEGRSTDHALSLGYALSTAACPTALLIGDLARADRLVAMLLDHSARYSLGPWSTWGRYFAGRLLLQGGDVADGLRAMTAALAELRATGFGLRFTAYLSELADGLGLAGRFTEGLALIEEALARCEQRQERWCLPELLRVKGGLLLTAGAPDVTAGATAAAAHHFRQSLDVARQQGALSWELRTATSLTRLLQARGEATQAHDILASVLGRFTEGFGTADLMTAKDLLAELTGPSRG